MPQTISSSSDDQSGLGGASLRHTIHDLHAWVEALPLADVNQSYQRVLDMLVKVNDGDLSCQEQFQTLELLRSPLQYLSDSLRYQLMGTCLPLTIKTRGIAAQLFKLHSEMARGYQHICEVLYDLNPMRQDFTTLTTSLHRSLHYLSQALLTGYQIYEPNTDDYWRRIHHTYDSAERKGLQSSIVKDPYLGNKQETSVAEQYKQILLLALANPYRHSQQDLAWVYTQLHHWAPLCQLHPVDYFDEPRYACLVDLASDGPPPYAADSPVPYPATSRLFETSAIIDMLLNALPRNPEQSAAQESGTVMRQTMANRSSLLYALITAWSLTAKRKFSRMQSDAVSISVRLGLSAVHQFIDIHHAKPDAEDADKETPATANIAKKPSNGEVTAGGGAYLCEVINESAGGACLKWRSANKGKIRVGELVAIGHSGESGAMPGIAVIRWLKSAGNHTVNFGVQLLAPDAIPIAIRVYSAKSQDGEHNYLKGLYVPEFQTTRQPPSLILPAFLYHSDDIVSVVMDGQEHSVQLTKLVDATQGFSRFRFDTDSTPDSSHRH